MGADDRPPRISWLNPALITTGVGGFEDAIAGRDLAAAADLYAGPFLDGFFMKDVPEFEHRVELQRTRWAARVWRRIRRSSERWLAYGTIGVRLDRLSISA